MDEAENAPRNDQPVNIPFNNLYLISGLVHGMNKSYMYFLTILFFLFAYFSYQLVAFPPLVMRLQANGFDLAEIVGSSNLLFNAEALRMDKNLVLAIELGMFVAAFFGFYTGLRFLHRKSLLSVLTGYERFRFGRFWFSFALWAVMIAALTIVGYYTDQGDAEIVFNPQGFMISALVLVILMPIQVGIEELVFRGYLMQGMAITFKNAYVPLIVTTLLFGCAHLTNPEVQKHGWELMLPYYCANGLFLGAITLLDEGIELAFGMHLANNIVSGLLVTTPNSVIQPYTVFMLKDENPGQEMIVWLVMALIAFAVYWYRFRWKHFSLLIK